MSNGVPPSALAASGSRAKAKVAAGSTNRRISQAQAVRSIWGCGLVTQSTESPLPARLTPPRLGSEVRDGIDHGRGGGSAAGGPEIVAPAFQAESALQAAELAEGVAHDIGVPRSCASASSPAAHHCVADRLGGGRNLGVPRVGLASEQRDQRSILCRGEPARLPNPGGPAVLLDLLGEPLAGL